MTQILIVDDDAHSLSGMIELLQTEGYDVVGVNNSYDAEHIMITQKIDCILLDYRLPNISGLELCELLKRHQPNVTIFLITAMYDRNLFDLARSIGIHEIFTKPIVMNELFLKLKRYADPSMRS